MRLINSGLEILEQQPGLDGMYKQIELAGRTCYKSEDKITEDSAKAFVDRMIKSGHGAMLEHGTVYLYCKADEDNNPLEDYFHNPYSKAIWIGQGKYADVYVTTNMRVLVEHNCLDDLKYLCEPTKYHAKRITVHFVCDRGVSHEFVRHRVFSFAQESTRYCNYSRYKFNNEVTFISPCWITDIHSGNSYDMELLNNYPLAETENMSPESIEFIRSLVYGESSYFTLLEAGWKPQQARAVLPNSLKTELVMTGFVSDWLHFFELRCAPSAHPDAQKLAKELLVKLNEMYPGKFDELYNKYINHDGE